MESCCGNENFIPPFSSTFIERQQRIIQQKLMKYQIHQKYGDVPLMPHDQQLQYCTLDRAKTAPNQAVDPKRRQGGLILSAHGRPKHPNTFVNRDVLENRCSNAGGSFTVPNTTYSDKLHISQRTFGLIRPQSRPRSAGGSNKKQSNLDNVTVQKDNAAYYAMHSAYNTIPSNTLKQQQKRRSVSTTRLRGAEVLDRPNSTGQEKPPWIATSNTCGPQSRSNSRGRASSSSSVNRHSLRHNERTLDSRNSYVNEEVKVKGSIRKAFTAVHHWPGQLTDRHEVASINLLGMSQFHGEEMCEDENVDLNASFVTTASGSVPFFPGATNRTDCSRDSNQSRSPMRDLYRSSIYSDANMRMMRTPSFEQKRLPRTKNAQLNNVEEETNEERKRLGQTLNGDESLGRSGSGDESVTGNCGQSWKSKSRSSGKTTAGQNKLASGTAKYKAVSKIHPPNSCVDSRGHVKLHTVHHVGYTHLDEVGIELKSHSGFGLVFLPIGVSRDELIVECEKQLFQSNPVNSDQKKRSITDLVITYLEPELESKSETVRNGEDKCEDKLSSRKLYDWNTTDASSSTQSIRCISSTQRAMALASSKAATSSGLSPYPVTQKRLSSGSPGEQLSQQNYTVSLALGTLPERPILPDSCSIHVFTSYATLRPSLGRNDWNNTHETHGVAPIRAPTPHNELGEHGRENEPMAPVELESSSYGTELSSCKFSPLVSAASGHAPLKTKGSKSSQGETTSKANNSNSPYRYKLNFQIPVGAEASVANPIGVSSWHTNAKRGDDNHSMDTPTQANSDKNVTSVSDLNVTITSMQSSSRSKSPPRSPMLFNRTGLTEAALRVTGSSDIAYNNNNIPSLREYGVGGEYGAVSCSPSSGAPYAGSTCKSGSGYRVRDEGILVNYGLPHTTHNNSIDYNSPKKTRSNRPPHCSESEASSKEKAGFRSSESGCSSKPPSERNNENQNTTSSGMGVHAPSRAVQRPRKEEFYLASYANTPTKTPTTTSRIPNLTPIQAVGTPPSAHWLLSTSQIGDTPNQSQIRANADPTGSLDSSAVSSPSRIAPRSPPKEDCYNEHLSNLAQQQQYLVHQLRLGQRKSYGDVHESDSCATRSSGQLRSRAGRESAVVVHDDVISDFVAVEDSSDAELKLDALYRQSAYPRDTSGIVNHAKAMLQSYNNENKSSPSGRAPCNQGAYSDDVRQKCASAEIYSDDGMSNSDSDCETTTPHSISPCTTRSSSAQNPYPLHGQMYNSALRNGYQDQQSFRDKIAIYDFDDVM